MRPTHRGLMLFAAALCVAVAAVHVDDQGGITAFTDPDWLGWAYRLIEVGGVVTAGALAFCAGRAVIDGYSRLIWLGAALVGAGPFAGYILTRTVGLPQDPGDVGNWNDPVGTTSLVVEGLLVLVALTGLALSRTAPARSTHGAAAHTVQPLAARS